MKHKFKKKLKSEKSWIIFAFLIWRQMCHPSTISLSSTRCLNCLLLS